MIIITGAAGFIGSYVASHLNKANYKDLVLSDILPLDLEKQKNIAKLNYKKLIDYRDLLSFIENEHIQIEAVIHLGACSSTTEFNVELLNELNLHYSQKLWNSAVRYGFPLIYASSAATYGDGSFGYSDSHDDIEKYRPLNPYGESKHQFDLWALKQPKQPSFWAGLKFFNVYGPNEYHKGSMASVIFHTFHRIEKDGKALLFKSYLDEYRDGEQKRDFLHVRDCAQVIKFLMETRKHSGIYNVGAGTARSFNDLASATMKAMNLKPCIEYVDMPLEIRDKYQYFTEANIDKLRSIGYHEVFFTLEEGIDDYVRNYLLNNFCIY